MSSTLSPDPHQRSPEYLDQYASERWDSVLQFLVQPQEGLKAAISRDAMRTLLHAKLIERSLLIGSYFTLDENILLTLDRQGYYLKFVKTNIHNEACYL